MKKPFLDLLFLKLAHKSNKWGLEIFAFVIRKHFVVFGLKERMKLEKAMSSF